MTVIGAMNMDTIDRRADDDADVDAPDADDADFADDEPPTPTTRGMANNKPKTTAVDADADEDEDEDEPNPTAKATAKTTNRNAGQDQPPKTTAAPNAVANKPTTIPSAIGNAADPTITPPPAWLSDFMVTQTSQYTWGKDRSSDVLYAQSAYSTILAANPALAAVNMTGNEFNLFAKTVNSSQRGCYADMAFPMALAMNDTCELGFFCT
jgi:hypothetical protein